MTHRADSDEPITFLTSGRTGSPVRWIRTAGQIEAEARVVASRLPGSIERVINCAPPTHLYGHIFGEALPELLKVPVTHAWAESLQPPTIPSDERVLIVCLPATWRLLRNLTKRLGAAPRVTAVHGAGQLTPEGRRVVSQLHDTTFGGYEVLGSTETGAIAHRRLDGYEWTLFQDVELIAEPHGYQLDGQALRVSSPRLARREGKAHLPVEEHTLDDIIVPTGERTFVLKGRGSRMLKVNGLRIYLDHIEDKLQEAFPEGDFACIPLCDAVLGEHYSVAYASSSPSLSEDHIRSFLRKLDSRPVAPRTLHRFEKLPRGGAGKVQVDRILRSLKQSTDLSIKGQSNMLGPVTDCSS